MAWLELPALRTAKAKHYRDDVSGLYRAVLTLHDQHYHDGSAWQEVDEAIVDDATRTGYIAKADRMRHAVWFGSGGERAWYPRREVTTEYVTAGKPDYWTGSRWRAWNLTGLVRGTNAVTWETADYRVTLTSIWRRVKLEIVLKTTAAPTRIRFPLALTGLAFSGWDLLSGSERVGSIDPPTAADATGAVVPISASYTGGYYELALTPGAAVYPITVDPTFTDGNGGDINTAMDTYMAQWSPTSGLDGESSLQTIANGTSLQRALIQFDLSSIAASAACVSAALSLRAIVLDGAGAGAAHSVYPVYRPWTETGACWNYYAGTSVWGTAGCADTVNDRAATACGTFNAPATAPNTVTCNLNTDTVQSWFGSNTNHGLLIKADSETAWDRVCYASSDNGTAADRPQLVVEWTESASGISIPVVMAAHRQRWN